MTLIARDEDSIHLSYTWYGEGLSDLIERLLDQNEHIALRE